MMDAAFKDTGKIAIGDIYDYLERTSDSANSSTAKYSDFLPFNSPYANTNGNNVVTYTYDPYGKLMSNITGVRMIGSDFLKRNHLTSEDSYGGLVDRMELFNGPNFNSNKLSKGIVDFYERTIDYEMKAKITWSKWFRPFAYVYEKISKVK